MSGQHTIYTLTSRRLRDLIGSSECTLSQLYTSIWGYARLHGLKRPRGTLQTDDQLAAVFGRRGVIHYSDLPQLLSPLISLGYDGFVAYVRRPKLYRPSDELKFVLQSQRQREICTFEEAVNGVKNYAIDKGLILDVHPMFIVTDSVLRPLFPAASVPLGMLGNFLWYALSPSAIVTTDFPKEYFAPPTTVTPNPALAAIIGEGSKTSQEILLDVAAYVLRKGLQKEGRVVVDDRLAALNTSWRPGSVIDKLTLFKRVAWSTVSEDDPVELPLRHPLRRPTALSKIFDAV
ncbi:hypothetical protein FOZ63_029552 [Perkinsus olseni]|uniref:DM2 domain-containing protein n=1 Tax=Perkinsus olseni TaxID=32597 RepID=A0A7J6TEG5_PEROL|nr:hypothetical protein FOZ63_029552 [Perkinsus olseni]